MTWGGTVDDAHKISEGTHAVLETMTLTNGSTGTIIGILKRNNLIITTRWVGLQESVAGAYVVANMNTASVEDIRAERSNDASAFAVIRQDIVYGTFA